MGKDTFFLYLDKIHILFQIMYLDTIQILFLPMYLDKIQIKILIHGIILPIHFRYIFWPDTIFIQDENSEICINLGIIVIGFQFNV